MSVIARLCTICARGGSQGVPNKNFKLLLGKPLIVYTIEHAKASGLFDMIAVSSDSEKILSVAKDAGVDILIKRPEPLATNESGKIGALSHAFSYCEKEYGQSFDTYVDMDATSPLRKIQDIKGAVNLLEESMCSSVITGCTSRKSPYFNLVELGPDNNVVLSKKLDEEVLRRQDSPKCYDMNGSIYVWKTDVFRNNPNVFYPDTRLFEMPEERSVDIDTPLDFKIVSILMSQNSN